MYDYAELKKLARSDYVNILKSELIPALGCTEPIAVALAGAVAKKWLSGEVICVRVAVSSNILKNVKSVVVPNTGGRKGIAAAVAVGIVAGDANRGLEVIADVQPEDKIAICRFLSSVPITVSKTESKNVFDILVELDSENHSVSVRIVGYHTNIQEIFVDGKRVYTKPMQQDDQPEYASCYLNVEDIFDFIENVPLEEIAPIIRPQIKNNMAISQEGLKNNYGANIGKVLLDSYGDEVEIRAQAAAAAASDARMSGCEMPVTVVSGSGNQGITACVPVCVYARELGATEERTIRAVALADLLTIHLKSGIGRLSAYCGVVCAGCAAGAAIAYINGGDVEMVCHTLVNSLAIVSGIICDGAKPSCAGKIGSAVNAGILGWQMYLRGNQFYGGDGIVRKGVENTIDNIGRLASKGMCETDNEIVRMMLEYE